VLAGLLAAVLLVYRPALHGAFLWDDKAHVTRADLRSWHGLWRIWFDVGSTQQHYPLVHTAFWVQHRLWGDAPFGYHVVNVLMHFGVAALAAVALRRLAVPGATLAAALFALHPVHVESVAWISELKNTLSAVLYLGAAIAWLRFRETKASGQGATFARGGAASLYALSLGLFVLALCSKTVTATLPAALLVVAWWQRGRLSFRDDVLPLAPWFALALCAAAFSIQVERKLVGAEGAAFDLTLVERALIAGRATWFYLGKLLWPANLTFIYPRWSIDASAAWQYSFPAAAVGILIALWRVRRRWRGPLLGALFFVGTLFPALGFFDVYPFLFSFVADHFQDLASLGILALAAACIARPLERRPARDRLIGFAVCGAALAILGALSWKQARSYSDRETLYRATIAANPGCWMAYNNLAGALVERGAVGEAVAFAQKALELRPRYPEAHNNLGLALRSQGRLDEAIAHFEQAVAGDPTDAGLQFNLATALVGGGRSDRAVVHLRSALQLDPGLPAAHNTLGMLLAGRGLLEEALAHFRQAVQLDPGSAEAHNNLGIALARRGMPGEAVVQFRRALELNPASMEVRRNLESAERLAHPR
jgi:Flp pilus assembly protein TadD